MTAHSIRAMAHVGMSALIVALLTVSSAHAQTETSISTTGEIESETGFRFPDASLQETAAQDELYNLDCQNGQATVYNALDMRWECADALQGPQGEKGDKGDDGTAGTAGTAGTDGTDGEDGAAGANCYEGIGTTTADCIGPQGPAGPVSIPTNCPHGDAIVWDVFAENWACETDLTNIYVVGDTGPAGGIVFYLEPGSDGRHGLEAAPAPTVGEDPIAPWCSTNSDIADVDNILSEEILDSHSGAHNAPLIAAVCGVNSAAGLAAAYVWPEGQTDGFLPNKEEMFLVYQNQVAIGGFASGSGWWCSSERDANFAWAQNFSAGAHAVISKSIAIRVRAVRAF